MRRRTLVVLVALLALAVSVTAEVVVAIHGHDDFSDGMQAPPDAYKAMCSGGAQVAILTDHLEVIELEKIPEPFWREEVMRYLHWLVAPLQPRKQAGLNGWKQAMRSLSIPPALYSVGGINILDTSKSAEARIIIPAVEMGLDPYERGGSADRRPHALFIGGSLEDDTYDRLLDALSATDARQCLGRVVEIAREKDALVIPAHPTNPGWLWTEELLRMVDGVEVMNHSADPADSRRDTPKAVIEAALSVAKPGLITAGMDWHGLPGERGSVDLFRRFNIVLADQMTPSAIMTALRSGRTYAAKDDVRITRGTELIGGRIEQSKPLEIQFSGLEGLLGNNASIAYRSADGICRGVKECQLKGNELDIPDLGKFLGPGMANGGWIYVCISGEIYTSAIRVEPRREVQPPRVAEKLQKQEKPKKSKRDGPSTTQQIASFLLKVLGNVQISTHGVPGLAPQAGQPGVPPPIAGAGRFVSAPRGQNDGLFPGTSMSAVLDLLPDGRGQLFLRLGDLTGTIPIGPENWPAGGRSLCVIEFGQPVGFNGPSGGTTRSFSMTGVALRWGRDASGAADAFRLSIHNMAETGRYQGLDPGLRNALSVMTGPSVYLYGVNGATWSR